MYLFRGGDHHAYNANDSEAAKKNMQAWMKWMESLGQKGILVGGEPLLPTGKQVNGSKKVVTDGPFVEAKELVGGYLIGRGGDLAHAAALVGSIGLVPSASFGSGAPLFEPIHGSAPTLAGRDSANPIGSILSITMMLRDSFGLGLEADWVEQSVVRVLSGGYRTPDLAGPGSKPIGTNGFMEILHVEMQRTLEHAERYGWGV